MKTKNKLLTILLSVCCVLCLFFGVSTYTNDTKTAEAFGFTLVSFDQNDGYNKCEINSNYTIPAVYTSVTSFSINIWLKEEYDPNYYIKSVTISGGENVEEFDGEKCAFDTGSEDVMITITTALKPTITKTAEAAQGSITCETEKVAPGDEVAFSVAPEDGYVIDEVTVNGNILGNNGTEGQYTFFATGSYFNENGIEIKATFKQKLAVVNHSSVDTADDNVGLYSVEGEESYKVGDTVTLTYTKKNEYIFDLDNIKFYEKEAGVVKNDITEKFTDLAKSTDTTGNNLTITFTVPAGMSLTGASIYVDVPTTLKDEVVYNRHVIALSNFYIAASGESEEKYNTALLADANALAHYFAAETLYDDVIAKDDAKKGDTLVVEAKRLFDIITETVFQPVYVARDAFEDCTLLDLKDILYTDIDEYEALKGTIEGLDDYQEDYFWTLIDAEKKTAFEDDLKAIFDEIIERAKAIEERYNNVDYFVEKDTLTTLKDTPDYKFSEDLTENVVVSSESGLSAIVELLKTIFDGAIVGNGTIGTIDAIMIDDEYEIIFNDLLFAQMNRLAEDGYVEEDFCTLMQVRLAVIKTYQREAREFEDRFQDKVNSVFDIYNNFREMEYSILNMYNGYDLEDGHYLGYVELVGEEKYGGELNDKTVYFDNDIDTLPTGYLVKSYKEALDEVREFNSQIALLINNDRTEDRTAISTEALGFADADVAIDAELTTDFGAIDEIYYFPVKEVNDLDTLYANTISANTLFKYEERVATVANAKTVLENVQTMLEDFANNIEPLYCNPETTEEQLDNIIAKYEALYEDEETLAYDQKELFCAHEVNGNYLAECILEEEAGFHWYAWLAYDEDMRFVFAYRQAAEKVVSEATEGTFTLDGYVALKSLIAMYDTLDSEYDLEYEIDPDRTVSVADLAVKAYESLREVEPLFDAAELVDDTVTVKKLIEEAVKEVTEAYQKADKGLQEQIDKLAEDIAELTKAYQVADEALNQAIKDLTTAYITADEEINTTIAKLEEAYLAADEKINKAIEDLETAYKTADGELKTYIDTVYAGLKQEVEDREKAISNLETALKELITAEEEARKAADAAEEEARKLADAAEEEARKLAIAAEATAREDADKALKELIEKETVAREEADKAEAKLRAEADEAEATARGNADKALQEAIDALQKTLNAEIETRTAEVKKLTEDLAQEVADRKQAIADEKQAREDADAEEKAARIKAIEELDAALTAKIEAEAKARETTDDEIYALIGAITDLNLYNKQGATTIAEIIAQLDKESQAADASLLAQVNTLSDTIATVLEALDLTSESANSIFNTFKSSLTQKVEGEVADRKEAINNLRSEVVSYIEAETAARKEADTAIYAKIAEVVSALEGEDADLDSALLTLEAETKTALSELEAKLTTARVTAETALKADIEKLYKADDEALKLALENADLALSGRIDTNAKDIAALYDTVAKLTENVESLVAAEREAREGEVEELNKLIDALQQEDAAINTSLVEANDKINALNESLTSAYKLADAGLQSAIDLLKQNDSDMEKSLTDAINSVKELLTEKINNNAKDIETINTAISKLQDALKAEEVAREDNVKELNEKIQSVTDSYEAADLEIKGIITTLEDETTKAIEDAKTTLTTAYELADEALKAAIVALYEADDAELKEAYELADKALSDRIDANKAELDKEVADINALIGTEADTVKDGTLYGKVNYILEFLSLDGQEKAFSDIFKNYFDASKNYEYANTFLDYINLFYVDYEATCTAIGTKITDETLVNSLPNAAEKFPLARNIDVVGDLTLEQKKLLCDTIYGYIYYLEEVIGDYEDIEWFDKEGKNTDISDMITLLDNYFDWLINDLKIVDDAEFTAIGFDSGITGETVTEVINSLNARVILEIKTRIAVIGTKITDATLISELTAEDIQAINAVKAIESETTVGELTLEQKAALATDVYGYIYYINEVEEDARIAADNAEAAQREKDDKALQAAIDQLEKDYIAADKAIKENVIGKLPSDTSKTTIVAWVQEVESELYTTIGNWKKAVEDEAKARKAADEDLAAEIENVRNFAIAGFVIAIVSVVTSICLLAYIVISRKDKKSK